MSHNQKTAPWIFILCLSLLTLAIAGLILIPEAINSYSSFQPSHRTKFSRARSDMRSLATAIETYRLDNGCYPMMSPTISFQSNIDFALSEKRILRADGELTMTAKGLTSPISYLSETFSDEFITLPYAYYTYKNRYILYSIAYDQIYNIQTPETILSASTEKEMRERLAPYTYDPSNGTYSNGDIWRLNQ